VWHSGELLCTAGLVFQWCTYVCRMTTSLARSVPTRWQLRCWQLMRPMPCRVTVQVQRRRPSLLLTTPTCRQPRRHLHIVSLGGRQRHIISRQCQQRHIFTLRGSNVGGRQGDGLLWAAASSPRQPLTPTAVCSSSDVSLNIYSLKICNHLHF